MYLDPGKKSNIKNIPIFNELKENGKLSKNDYLVKTGAIDDGSCLFHAIFYSYPEYYSLTIREQREFTKNKRKEISDSIDLETFLNLGKGENAFIQFSLQFTDYSNKFYKRNEFLQENLTMTEFENIIYKENILFRISK